MKLLYLFKCIIFSALLLSCNGLSDKRSSDMMKINFLLDDLEEAVSEYLPNMIVDVIHEDFLHNGLNRQEQIYIWEERLLKYYSLIIDNREIVITDDQATVYFDMNLFADDDTIYLSEPSEEYGDMSFLIKEDKEWYLYGNGK